jgi:hypothetical protein
MLREASMKRSAVIFCIFILLFVAACNILTQQAVEQQSPPVVAQEQPTDASNLPRIELMTATSEEVAHLAEPSETPTFTALDHTAIWIVNETDRAILLIDPETDLILTRVQIGGIPKAVVEGAGSVWVVEGIDEQSSNILRINTSISQVVSSIPITRGEVTSIITGGESVWVGVAAPAEPGAMAPGVDFTRLGGVVRIDPYTNQVAEFIDTNAMVVDLLYENNILWTLEWAGMSSYMEQIDLVSRVISSIPASIDSAEYIHAFARMAKNSAGFWTTPIDPSSYYIFRINPQDGRIEAFISVGEDASDHPVDIVADQNNVWVALKGGDVALVDAASGELKATIPTGGNDLSGIFFGGDGLWAVSVLEAAVYHIDPQTHEVLAALSTGNRPLPTATSTLTPTVDLNAPYQPCESTYDSHLNVGMHAIVNSDPWVPNRVRMEPNRQSEIVGYLQPGETMEILAGPACSDGWIWWSVRSDSTGLTGWTSEGDETSYWLSPAP